MTVGLTTAAQHRHTHTHTHHRNGIGWCFGGGEWRQMRGGGTMPLNPSHRNPCAVPSKASPWEETAAPLRSPGGIRAYDSDHVSTDNGNTRGCNRNHLCLRGWGNVPIEPKPSPSAGTMITPIIKHRERTRTHSGSNENLGPRVPPQGAKEERRRVGAHLLIRLSFKTTFQIDKPSRHSEGLFVALESCGHCRRRCKMMHCTMHHNVSFNGL